MKLYNKSKTHYIYVDAYCEYIYLQNILHKEREYPFWDICFSLRSLKINIVTNLLNREYEFNLTKENILKMCTEKINQQYYKPTKFCECGYWLSEDATTMKLKY